MAAQTVPTDSEKKFVDQWVRKIATERGIKNVTIVRYSPSLDDEYRFRIDNSSATAIANAVKGWCATIDVMIEQLMFVREFVFDESKEYEHVGSIDSRMLLLQKFKTWANDTKMGLVYEEEEVKLPESDIDKLARAAYSAQDVGTSMGPKDPKWVVFKSIVASNFGPKWGTDYPSGGKVTLDKNTLCPTADAKTRSIPIAKLSAIFAVVDAAVEESLKHNTIRAAFEKRDDNAARATVATLRLKFLTDLGARADAPPKQLHPREEEAGKPDKRQAQEVGQPDKHQAHNGGFGTAARSGRDRMHV